MWTSVYSSKNRISAELVKNELVNKGINAVVLDKIDASYPVLGRAEVHVPDGQIGEARLVVAELNVDDKEP